MKKFVIVLGVIIVLILGAAAILPIIFKDDIKAEIDKALAEYVNADIEWDADGFGISLFTNFPNATAQLNNFAVINRAPFAGTKLFAVESFEVEIDLFSLFGDQIVISGIELIKPDINIYVLKDGTANYDIAVPSNEPEEEASSDSDEPAAFDVGIDHWAIVEGHVVYSDETLPFKMELTNLNHSGSGNFNQNEFDISSLTDIASVNVEFDGVEYMSEKSFHSDIVMNISDNYGRYTFKENSISVNDFTLAFDGFLALNEDGSMDMDLTYGTKATTFKSLLSLVPGIYTEDFGSIETEGNLAFDGMVKGKYDSLTMPAFNLGLQVNDAMFKYPDLPTAITNISMDLKVDNKDGIIDNTVVDLKQFHIDFGKNPVDARVYIGNLVTYDLDANVKAKLNLAEINSMFPVEGLSMKGLYSVDVTAKGDYDTLRGKTPNVNANMSLTDGYIKSSELPYSLESIGFNASIQSPTGLMKDFKFNLKDFVMNMDGEEFTANLDFENLDNYTWKLDASGGIDLEKITKTFTLEGMSLAGKIRAKLQTEGNMADLEAERYAKLPTSGSMTIEGFKYEDEELPYNVTISNAAASFNPDKISLDNYTGTVGKSDMNMKGSISNYIAYILNDKEVLKGDLEFVSEKLNLNQFMSDEEVEETEEELETDTLTSMEVVQIPTNINFKLKTKIEKLRATDMTLRKVTGVVIIKDGILNLSKLKFNTLGGKFMVTGSYDANDKTKPKYDMTLDVSELSISKAYQKFSIIQEYVPIAKNMNGNVSTDFQISGLLGQDMMPVYESINGGGLLNVAQASLDKPEFVSKVSNLTKVGSGGDKVSLKDVTTSAKIENGNLSVEPFDINVGNYKTNVSGTSSVDGKLDYKMDMQIPAGALGTQVNSMLSQYTGGDGNSSTINLPIGVGGTYDEPTYKLLSPSGGSVKATDVAKVVVKDQVEKQLDVDLEKEKEKKRQEILAQARKQANRVRSEGKATADKTRTEGYAQADNLIKEAGSNPIKKKIAEEAAKKLRKETDDKAAKIESEANAKADKIMAEAKKKADAV